MKEIAFYSHMLEMFNQHETLEFSIGITNKMLSEYSS